MNSAQRRIAFRSIVREFIPGLAVMMPTGKTAHVVAIDDSLDTRSKPVAVVKRGDNRKVDIRANLLKIA